MLTMFTEGINQEVFFSVVFYNNQRSRPLVVIREDAG